MDPFLQLYKTVLGVEPLRAAGWPEAAEALKAGNRVQIRGDGTWSEVVLLELTEDDRVAYYHPVRGAQSAPAETLRECGAEFWILPGL